MKKETAMKYALAILLFASVAGAQTVPIRVPGDTGASTAEQAKTALLLTCGKYQHFEPSLTSMRGDMLIKLPDRCVDDLHMVSEREWQQLIDRIEQLERELKAATGGKR